LHSLRHYVKLLRKCSDDQKLKKSVQGFRSPRWLKIAISHWLEVSPLQQCTYALTCYTTFSWAKKLLCTARSANGSVLGLVLGLALGLQWSCLCDVVQKEETASLDTVAVAAVVVCRPPMCRSGHTVAATAVRWRHYFLTDRGGTFHFQFKGWVEQGLTSHQTHYRSYRGRVFKGQMTQPTVSSTEGSHKTKLNQIQRNTKIHLN